MITLTSVSKESINSPSLVTWTSPEDRKARWTMRRPRATGEARRTQAAENDAAAVSTVRPRPTEAHDENQREQPTPARGRRGYSTRQASAEGG